MNATSSGRTRPASGSSRRGGRAAPAAAGGGAGAEGEAQDLRDLGEERPVHRLAPVEGEGAQRPPVEGPLERHCVPGGWARGVAALDGVLDRLGPRIRKERPAEPEGGRDLQGLVLEGGRGGGGGARWVRACR